MGIGKRHSILGKFIDGRSFNFPELRIETLNIANPKIVTQDHHEIGFARIVGKANVGCEVEKKQHRKGKRNAEESLGFHHVLATRNVS